MRKRWAIVNAILSFLLTTSIVSGQGSAPASIAPRAASQISELSTKNPPTNATTKKDSTPTPSNIQPKSDADEPIVTEIYADKTVFDSAKSIGIFTGHVVVTDPRFNIQGDMLTVYISKKQNEGFERAVVEGNVGVVRDRPNPNGGPPEHMVGRADKAV